MKRLAHDACELQGMLHEDQVPVCISAAEFGGNPELWGEDQGRALGFPPLLHNLSQMRTAPAGYSYIYLVISLQLPILQIYPIKGKMGCSRLALIICDTEFDQLVHRDGAEHDIKGMWGLLESLDYTVEVKGHLTAKAMEDVLQEFAGHPEHQGRHLLVLLVFTFLVFMSHGSLEGICGTKHGEENPDMLPQDTIFQIFNIRNCSLLKDKPKVIIIQTCRGEKPGSVLVSDSSGASADSYSPANLKYDAVHRTHVEKDFVSFYSSTPYTVSWRDPRKISLFMTELITCFQNFACRYHLLEIFQKVQQSFEKRCDQFQMPTIERLNMPKCFYLFPGI
ncbi:LOW QUALITY PROTEIN: caspase-13-like [Talpa occidentalis]|uniref:LOW QUALITY PROTEIN: caspase-13-like n=1 Tax=Talpa occidentalis TaxID=50954 RepID=UPI00188FD1A7|nr:LOW QUALITY PROTEIN: caspase-13-like [Talpa occidentalis]